MKTPYIAFAAALLLHSPATSQVPAGIDLESVTPLSGSWSYVPVPNGTQATFADALGVRLIVRCNRAARTVTLIRTGVAIAAPTLSIWTTSHSRSIPATFQTTGELSASLSARDPLLDAIAFSRGRFATGAAGVPMVAVPVWPEPARVIEDCRS